MPVASNGYRAALVRHPLTPGLISSSSGTAGLPPFISFSTSYPELPPVLNCMARRGQGAGDRRGQGTVGSGLGSRDARTYAAGDRGGREGFLRWGVPQPPRRRAGGGVLASTVQDSL